MEKNAQWGMWAHREESLGPSKELPSKKLKLKNKRASFTYVFLPPVPSEYRKKKDKTPKKLPFYGHITLF